MVVRYDITKAEKYLLCILWTTTTFLIRSSTLVVPRVWSFLCVVNKSETETNGNGHSVWAVSCKSYKSKSVPKGNIDLWSGQSAAGRRKSIAALFSTMYVLLR